MNSKKKNNHIDLICCRMPLHAAAFAGHVDCVQLLLAHDAPVDAVDQSGRSALMMAAERGAVGVVGMKQFPLPFLLCCTDC